MCSVRVMEKIILKLKNREFQDFNLQWIRSENK